MSEGYENTVNQEGGNEAGSHMDLQEQFAHLTWRLHRFHLRNHRDHGPMGDPHRGQGRILALLKLQPEISQKDLSYLLDMRPQSLGELLAKLERNDYITRAPSQADRRVLVIKLTEKGAREAEQSTADDELFSCLNEEEQAALSGYLDRIMAAMDEKFGDEPLERPDFGRRSGGLRVPLRDAARMMGGGGGGMERGRGRGFGYFRRFDEEHRRGSHVPPREWPQQV